MDSSEILKYSIDAEQQCIFVKFCVLKNHSAGLIHQELTRILGRRSVSFRTVARWLARYRSGDTTARTPKIGSRGDEDLRQERIDRIKDCFDESRHWSVRSLASRTGISKSTVGRIVRTELCMKKILGKWVPHVLTDSQQDHRIISCRMNLMNFRKTKSLLKRTISIDETWVSLYMQPDRNQQRNTFLQVSNLNLLQSKTSMDTKEC